MRPAGVSIIIRARDERDALRRCIAALHGQAGVEQVEVILVDGGSTDGTPDLARQAGAAVIAAPEPFSFGGALNAGAAAARHELLVALSAHAPPADDGWLARLIAAFADDRVACACGDRYDPEGRPLTAAIAQDAALARRRPEWGYANGAGAFRADLWRRRPFREDLPGCEDKEWAWHWLQQGRVCVIDPALAVEHDHTHDALRAIFTRTRREVEGYAAYLDGDAPGPRTLVGLARAWWSDTRWYGSPLRARVSHRRMARLLGAYAGRPHRRV
jgi:rhamnosyltransferase